LKRRYHPPLTTTRRALLVGGSDTEFRRLIYRLVVVEERLRRVRDFLARRVGLTGPQYTLLITIAYLQGESGIAVRAREERARVERLHHRRVAAPDRARAAGEAREPA
jgi:hypothetical protein